MESDCTWPPTVPTCPQIAENEFQLILPLGPGILQVHVLALYPAHLIHVYGFHKAVSLSQDVVMGQSPKLIPFILVKGFDDSDVSCFMKLLGPIEQRGR